MVDKDFGGFVKFTKCLIVFLCLSFAIAGRDALAESKTVLIVYSYDENMAWTRQCDQGISEELFGDVTIERLYMDTKRIPEDEFEERAEAAIQEFERIQPDLVMLSDDNALRLVGPEIAAHGVPVVYFGINGNPREYFEELPENVTGLIERITLFNWIRLLFEVVPDARSALVLMDNSPTSDAIVDTAFHGGGGLSVDGKQIVWKEASDWKSWKYSVLEIQNDIILMPVYHALKDEAGRHVPFDEVIAWTSRNSRVPVFAAQDYAVGDEGVVGAFVVAGKEHGRQAGSMAKKILEGTPIKDFMVTIDQQGAYYFNRKQLRRYGLVLPGALRRMVNFKE